jgi:hypothetical protein
VDSNDMPALGVRRLVEELKGELRPLPSGVSRLGVKGDRYVGSVCLFVSLLNGYAFVGVCGSRLFSVVAVMYFPCCVLVIEGRDQGPLHACFPHVRLTPAAVSMICTNVELITI